jgi:dihydropyrimidinase
MAETYDVLIRGGRVVTPDGVIRADIGVRDGLIVSLEAGGLPRGSSRRRAAM